MGIKVYYISKQGIFQYKSSFSKHLWGESCGRREGDALLQIQSVSLGVTCYALAAHRPIYSYFPALRAPSFFYTY